MITNEQKVLVQTSFKQIVPIADVAAKLFYTRLFTLNPQLCWLFKGDMVEQGHKLMQILSVAVYALDKLDELLPTFQKLGERHVQYGIKPSDYPIVGEALLWTLEQGLGEDFTPATRQAWIAVYAVLAGSMQEAARKLVDAPTLEIAYPR